MIPNRINSEPVGGESNGIPLWVRVFVFAGGLLMVLGSLIALVKPAMLISPEVISNGARIYAGYFVARNLALGLFLPLLLVLRARRALGSMLVLAGVIQVLDVVMDCVERRWPIVPGVLVLGILYLIAASRVSGAPFWRLESWGD